MAVVRTKKEVPVLMTWAAMRVRSSRELSVRIRAVVTKPWTARNHAAKNS